MARGQAGSGAHLAPAGRDSSQDERGACALLSTQLSSLLGERPVTHREVQGNESDLFMDYFPRGLTYQVWGSPGVLGVLPVLSIPTKLPAPEMGAWCHCWALRTLSTLLHLR